MTTRPRLAVVTPWYPSVANPVLGNFVAEWTRLASGSHDVRVVNSVEWPGGPQELVDLHRPTFDALIRRMGTAGALDARGDVGTITRVPHVLVGGWSVPERASSAAGAVAGALPDLEADVLHGHVGYFGGLVAARVAPSSSRLVVTEHSSEAHKVLADPRGLELYQEVMERAEYLTCVSNAVRSSLVEHLPDHADRIVVVPNPVDFDRAPRRPAPPESLDRWVFVGGLTELKGVQRLMSAFLRFCADRPSATLDLFGDGPLKEELQDVVAGSAHASRVTFHGNVPKRAVLEQLPSFDVLVAPSRFETFHLAVVEAVAAGVPVVVTRSGGPEEALGGSLPLCGRLIDVSEDPDEIIDAVRDLESGLVGLDLDGVRVELATRLGRPRVADRLAELYGMPVEPGGMRPVPTDGGSVRPRSVDVFARRTWRSNAVGPQVSLAQESDVEVNVIGVPQPERQTSQPTTAGRVIRKLRHLVSAVRSSAPPVPADNVIALLGDMTSARDVAEFWSAHPWITPSVELDPTDFGRPPVDAPA